MAKPKEGFLETQAGFGVSAESSPGDLTIAAGATAGTVSAGAPAAGDILTFLDDNGFRQFRTVQSFAAPNIVFSQTVPNAVTALAYKVAIVNSPYFVVRDQQNTTSNYRDPFLGRKITAPRYKMIGPNPNGVSKPSDISKEHGITITSIYTRFPIQQAGADASIMLRFFKNTADDLDETFITDLGINGELYLPIENTETPMKIFIPPMSEAIAQNKKWYLSVNLENSKTNQDEVLSNDDTLGYVSNVNVPASLNGLALPMVIGIRFTYGGTITG